MNQNHQEGKYFHFYGSTTEQLSRMIKSGLTSINFYEQMKRSLNIMSNYTSESKDELLFESIHDFSDAIIQDSKGSVKLITNLDELQVLILTNSEYKSKTHEFDKTVYSLVDGEEFDKKTVGSYLNGKPRSLSKSKEDPFLQSLAFHDISLLNEFLERSYFEGKSKYKHEEMFGIHLQKQRNDSVVSFLTLGGLYNGNRIYSGLSLDQKLDHLIGVSINNEISGLDGFSKVDYSISKNVPYWCK